MRSGKFDQLVTFTRAAVPQRDGRSRVAGAPVELAADVPCQIEGGVGTERFASAENAATAPFIIRCRLEPDLVDLKPADRAVDQDGRDFDIKSVRPDPKDPRGGLEIAAVLGS